MDSAHSPTPLGLAPELGGPMAAAHQAQRRPGFAWHTLGELPYLEVSGARFFPTPEELAGRYIRRGGRSRWLAVPLVFFALLGILDAWLRLDAASSKIGMTLVLGLVAALGVFVFRALGPEETLVRGIARHGLYVFPDHLVLWRPRPDGDELRLVVRRDQVRRFTHGNAGADIAVELERSSGELDTASTGLAAGSDEPRAWLEAWRETGRLAGEG